MTLRSRLAVPAVLAAALAVAVSHPVSTHAARRAEGRRAASVATDTVTPVTVSQPVAIPSAAPTSATILVQRLATLGADPSARDAAVAAAGDALRTGVPADVDALVASLGLRDAESRKAGILLQAYLDRQPLQLLGLDDVEGMDDVRSMTTALVESGVDPDQAAWNLTHDAAGQPLDALPVASEIGMPVLHAPIAGGGSDAPSPLALCKTCPNFDFGAFSPTTSWATHSSSLAAGDCKMYKFTLQANRTYRFTFCEGGGSAAFDTILTAYSGGCTQVGQNDDTCGTKSTLDITTSSATAYYFVRVSSKSGVGAYTLAYKQTASVAPTCKTCPNYDAAYSTPTTTWQTISGSITSGSCLIYRFPVLVNHNYRFSFCDGGGDAGFDTVIEVMRGTCALAVSNDDNCGLLSEVDYFSNTSQYVYVKVRGYSSSDYGPFTLAYVDYPTTCISCPNVNFTATPTPTGTVHQSSLVDGSACKRYAMNLAAGRTYRFSTCENGGYSNFDSYIELDDSSCNSVASSDDACGWSSTIEYTPGTSGVYYLTVYGYSGGTYGLYYVESCRPCPLYHATLAPPTASEQDYFDSIVTDGCRIYRVYLNASTDYAFSTCPGVGAGQSTFATTMEVLDPSCVSQWYLPDVCGYGSFAFITATSSGYYYVIVRGDTGTESGPFELAYWSN